MSDPFLLPLVPAEPISPHGSPSCPTNVIVGGSSLIQRRVGLVLNSVPTVRSQAQSSSTTAPPYQRQGEYPPLSTGATPTTGDDQWSRLTRSVSHTGSDPAWECRRFDCERKPLLTRKSTRGCSMQSGGGIRLRPRRPDDHLRLERALLGRARADSSGQRSIVGLAALVWTPETHGPAREHSARGRRRRCAAARGASIFKMADQSRNRSMERLAPSMMNSRQTSGRARARSDCRSAPGQQRYFRSRPRPGRADRLSPLPSMPSAATSTRSLPICRPSI